MKKNGISCCQSLTSYGSKGCVLGERGEIGPGVSLGDLSEVPDLSRRERTVMFPQKVRHHRDPGLLVGHAHVDTLGKTTEIQRQTCK